MDKSYSKHNLTIAINSILTHSEVMVYWDGEGFQAVADDGTYPLNSIHSTRNLLGKYNSWSTTKDILDDADFFMKQLNEVVWPEEARIDAIGQNGNTGEHYER